MGFLSLMYLSYQTKEFTFVLFLLLKFSQSLQYFEISMALDSTSVKKRDSCWIAQKTHIVYNLQHVQIYIHYTKVQFGGKAFSRGAFKFKSTSYLFA